jgi:hypothetical protein
VVEQLGADLAGFPGVIVVGEFAGSHVIDERVSTWPEGGDCGAESFPFPALGVGEDQVKAT